MNKIVQIAAVLVSLALPAIAAPLPLSVVPGPDNAPSVTEYVQAGSLLSNPADGKVLHDKTIVVRNGQIVEIHDGFVGSGHIIDLRGKFVLRLAIGNIAVTDADVRETWNLIRSCAPR